MFEVSFDSWCGTINLYLLLISGRPLADAPYSTRVLRIWWRHNIPPRVVANVCAYRMAQVARVTFTRWYTDRTVERMQETMIGRVRV